MPAAIKLIRIGKKHQPSYRIVVVDKRKKRNGSYIELLGTYNPLTNPPVLSVDRDKLKDWLGKGAQLSDGTRKLKLHLRKSGPNQ